MLPFLPQKRNQSIIMGRKEEGKPMELPAEEHPLMSAAEDLIHAVHSKDAHAVAEALDSAFQISDSLDDEGEQE